MIYIILSHFTDTNYSTTKAIALIAFVNYIPLHSLMWNPEFLQKLANYNLVLGSTSPRRQEILRTVLGLTSFSVASSTFEEDLPKEGVDKKNYVTNTAHGKIESIVSSLSHDQSHILIVADTIVCCGDEIFEKPETPEKQLLMLQCYREHGLVEVLTSTHVCLIKNGSIIDQKHRLVETFLLFDTDLTDEELDFYVNSGEGLHVAGGFKYQSMGSMLFNGLSGDYYNVVGLPVSATTHLLKEIVKN